MEKFFQEKNLFISIFFSFLFIQFSMCIHSFVVFDPLANVNTDPLHFNMDTVQSICSQSFDTT